MNPLFIFSNRYWLPIISIIVVLNFAAAAMATPATSYVSGHSKQGNGQHKPAITTFSQYQSSFQQYQRFNDQEVGVWKELNDTTARVGGWREYAKQAQTSDHGSVDRSLPVVDHAKTKAHGGHSH